MGYIIQVPSSVRYHRNGRHIWGLTQFRNKDYTTLGHETYPDAKKDALYYCKWYEVQRWVLPATTE